MAEVSARPRLPRTTLVSTALVIVGIGLTGVSWWFLAVAALGAFGPGALRELGLLDDKDEFQRQADHRAAYHAYLTTGTLTFLAIAYLRSAERGEPAGEVALFLLAVLWFTWLFSSLLAYWGPVRTATRTLLVFGAIWLVFNVLANIGDEWAGPVALVMQSLLAAPFFALAWLASRQPRITGGLLIAAAAFFFWLFGGFGGGNLPVFTRALVFVLFQGPLLASGIALLAAKALDDDVG